jgi:6-phosphogluconolactonase
MPSKLPPPPAPSVEVRVLPDLESLAEEGAREFAAAAAGAVRDRGLFRVALAGGSTPRALHRRLTAPPCRGEIDWARARFFWGDERCVPPEAERSNYRMAWETLLEPLAIPPEAVFRMRGEEEPQTAAALYEQVLAGEFAGEAGRPRFDLVLLGVGPDGHTASLFPGTPALTEHRRRVVANHVPKFDEWRLTLTFPVFNAARRVMFLAAGGEKSGPVARIIKKERGYRSLPAARIRPRNGRLLWLLDEAAGRGL